ncbi:hypothetical protein HanXRQr2_Chr16g0728991 [Helianthus annuus]|uniref:Uncharacterized protein n=1 Tax=Helianthus annuus TaxID=4232 RepID=A0A251S0K3_HELAN|nr:hypothetical protein HanXRQr2_Chr16g0728991 [Helianthus annuus]KAJ0440999.1 hypothetical protein HanIR_Chr16g0792821 [Helianthus annuus]KAJ0819677.1 hypothetical protein HanPSC8_Chr16g0698811 [Helianthus annuus]
MCTQPNGLLDLQNSSLKIFKQEVGWTNTGKSIVIRVGIKGGLSLFAIHARFWRQKSLSSAKINMQKEAPSVKDKKENQLELTDLLGDMTDSAGSSQIQKMSVNILHGYPGVLQLSYGLMWIWELMQRMAMKLID